MQDAREASAVVDRMGAMIRAIDAHLAACAPTDDGVAAVIDHARRCTAEALAKAAPASPAPAADGSAANPASARYFGPALESARHGPLAALVDPIRAAGPDLAWFYGYPSRPGEEDLPERVAFSQYLGPRVRHFHDRTRLGFTLIGPGTHYPAHAHPAVELYYVLAGTARWMTPTSDALRPPGAFILHRSGEPHAMETLGEPLLAFYAWAGDIEAPSVYTPGALGGKS